VFCGLGHIARIIDQSTLGLGADYVNYCLLFVCNF